MADCIPRTCAFRQTRLQTCISLSEQEEKKYTGLERPLRAQHIVDRATAECDGGGSHKLQWSIRQYPPPSTETGRVLQKGPVSTKRTVPQQARIDTKEHGLESSEAYMVHASPLRCHCVHYSLYVKWQAQIIKEGQQKYERFPKAAPLPQSFVIF